MASSCVNVLINVDCALVVEFTAVSFKSRVLCSIKNEKLQHFEAFKKKKKKIGRVNVRVEKKAKRHCQHLQIFKVGTMRYWDCHLLILNSLIFLSRLVVVFVVVFFAPCCRLFGRRVRLQ